jgi:hypothetical protein
MNQHLVPLPPDVRKLAERAYTLIPSTDRDQLPNPVDEWAKYDAMTAAARKTVRSYNNTEPPKLGEDRKVVETAKPEGPRAFPCDVGTCTHGSKTG